MQQFGAATYVGGSFLFASASAAEQKQQYNAHKHDYYDEPRRSANKSDYECDERHEHDYCDGGVATSARTPAEPCAPTAQNGTNIKERHHFTALCSHILLCMLNSSELFTPAVLQNTDGFYIINVCMSAKIDMTNRGKGSMHSGRKLERLLGRRSAKCGGLRF